MADLPDQFDGHPCLTSLLPHSQYNKNDEGASRGARNVAIRLEDGGSGGATTLSAVLRRAPGHAL